MLLLRSSPRVGSVYTLSGFAGSKVGGGFRLPGTKNVFIERNWIRAGRPPADGGDSTAHSRFPVPTSSESNGRLDWDPWEDLFGLGADLHPRSSAANRPTPGFGPSGETLKEIPCPTCRGRGYTLCPNCKMIANLEASCLQCGRRGFLTCSHCHGERVIWVESINESVWESAQPRSPLLIADDEAIDSMEIPPKPKRKTNRVYAPPSPEVRAKISRALKDLEARTGSISRRLKQIHQDPILHAERVSAIKKARSTKEARTRTSEKLKAYFKSPENRLKRSQSMIGVRFTCTYCGEEGHRRHFCPKLGYEKKGVRAPGSTTRTYRCSNCGQIGHQSRRCQQQSIEAEGQDQGRNPRRLINRCGVCRRVGHTRTSCPELATMAQRPRSKVCSTCGQSGHDKRTCTMAAKVAEESIEVSPRLDNDSSPNL